MSNSSDFNLDWIRQQTGVEGIHFFHEVDSTNNVALEYARNHSADAVELFLAERQTQGRGRSTNRWFSSAGSLTFSLLTRSLTLASEQVPQVSLAVGVAICQALEHVLPQADIALKWPNDVFLGDRKVCGILIELPSTAQRRFVIGVGINVNNSFHPTSAEHAFAAVSMLDYLGGNESEAIDRSALLIECLAQIDEMLVRLSAGDSSLADLWRAYSYLTGRQVRLETAQSQLVGHCISIADDGALLVQTASGIEHCYGGVVAEYH